MGRLIYIIAQPIVLIVGLIGIVVVLLLASGAIQLATLSPTPTFTPTPTHTRTPIPPTDTPTATPPSPTPASPTADPSRTAAIRAANIYLQPNANSQILGFVRVDESVTILGRSTVGNWFHIQTDKGLKGFAFRTFFDWTGDFTSLTPISAGTGPVPTPTPRATSGAQTPAAPVSPTSDFIGIDFFPISDEPNGHCNPAGYTLQIQGQGTLGPFQYYINDEFVGTSNGVAIYNYVYPGVQPNVAVIGKVVAKDGRSVEKKLFLRRPNC